MASDPITSWQVEGEKVKTVTDFVFLDSKITADSDCSHKIKRHMLLGRKAKTNPDSILKSRDIALPTKVYLVKASFFSSHVWMWELDHKEGWLVKNWCFWTVVLEKTLESPLDCKGVKSVNPKGNKPWIVIGRAQAEDEVPILWPPDVKSWLIRKASDAGNDIGRRRGVDRGWVDWMASHTQWRWVWANSRRWWRTGKPGVLQSMGSQSVGHNWATE